MQGLWKYVLEQLTQSFSELKSKTKRTMGNQLATGAPECQFNQDRCHKQLSTFYGLGQTAGE